MLEVFYKDEVFRLYFNMLKGLAYLPAVDVLSGFVELSDSSPDNFIPMLKYLERYYIGKLTLLNKRTIPRYPISTWNLYQRVLEGKPRTNNPVESWRGQLTKDEKSHLTVNKLVEKLRKEQSHSENLVIQIKSNASVQVKRKAHLIERDLKVLKIVKSYKENEKMFFLKKLALSID